MAGDGGTNTSQMPLAGVVTCCTSIAPEQRAEFAAYVAEMGGVNKLDLTSEVTHLIVGGYDTPKYKYVAKERPDVKCLLPDWLAAVRESWMEGGETDVETLEQEYKLPTFYDMRICVTGFQDCEGLTAYQCDRSADFQLVQIRKQIEETVKSNGGEYRGDLTKEVTHLIAKVPNGAKYLHAKQWGLQVVSPEWFQHSIDRGMILEETLYDPLMDESARGIGAVVEKSASSTSLGKRVRQDSSLGVRKLRRTASTKFSSQSEALWGDIVGGGFTSKQDKKDEWEEEQSQDVSKAPEIQRTETPTLPDIPRAGSAPIRKPSAKRGFLHGRRFFLHGFDTKRTAVLEKALRSHEAGVSADLEQLSQSGDSKETPSSYIIIPHTSLEKDIPLTPAGTPEPKVVNELWLEKCLHAKQYVEPETNVTYTPFQYPIEGFDALKLSTTGFQDVELMHVGKTIRLLGATYAGTLTKDISALVCHNEVSPSREKIQFAIKWNVPVVKADWLWDSMKAGKLMSLWDYLVHPNRQSRPMIDTNDDDDEGDRDFHNPKRSKSGPRRKEHDYGEPRTWLRRKSTSKSEDDQQTGPASKDNEQTITHQTSKVKTRQAISSVEDSFASASLEMDDSIPIFHAPNEKGDASTTVGDLNHPGPLRERSPNSPNKSFTNKVLDAGPTTKTKDVQRESLSSAISSLLAARQREPNVVDTTTRTSGRRKRTLFGRASSNLSTRSASHISRASSVDTLNTDGLGTPLECGPLSAEGTKSRDPLTEALLREGDADKEGDMGTQEEQQPPMTQVGYQEEEAEAWREKLAKKMGWKSEGSEGASHDGEGERKGKAARTVAKRSVVGDTEGIGVGRRMRQGLHRGA